MIVSFKRILLNFYLVLQIFVVSMGLLCGFISYAETDPLKEFQNLMKENIPSSVERVKNSVVRLDIGKTGGTGFILEDGLLVTNVHVLKGLLSKNYFDNKMEFDSLSQIKIFQEGQLLDVQVTGIQALDPIHDLALLNIKGDIPPVIKKPRKKVDLKKEQLFFVGYPYGQLKAIGQKGPIRIFESEIHIPIFSGKISGASGSPVVNKKGQVRGIITAGSSTENKAVFYNSDSLFSLQNAGYGVQCSKNTSIKNCFQQAEDFHLKEAQKGDTYAQYTLGLYFIEEYFNHKEGMKWLEQAAQKGFASAQTELGHGFLKLEQYKEAIKWFELASQNGNINSIFQLGIMYHQGKGVPQNYKKAMEFFKAAASQKSMPNSRYNVAFMYARGEGVFTDHKEAIRWHESAVEIGSLKSLFALGLYYYFGKKGVSQDYKKAFEYFKLAAQKGNSDAYYILGIMYNRGQGVTQNYKNGFEYLKLASQKGNIDAHYRLSIMYYEGQGTSKNLKKAFEYLKMAAQEGSSEAYYTLGLMYNHGQGVPQDINKGFEYLEKAAQKGSQEAQDYLNKFKNNKCAEVFNKGAHS